MASSRRKWMLAAGGILLVLLVFFALWVPKTLRTRTLRRAWANARQCLIGEPLSPGESLQTRLRGLELGLSTKAQSAQSPEQTWPRRCAPVLRQLAQAAKAQGAYPELADAAAAEAENLTTADPGLWGHSIPDALFSGAAPLGVEPVEAATSRPPTPVKPLLAAATPLETSPFLRLPGGDAYPVSGPVLVTKQDRLCAFVAASTGKALSDLQCHKLPAKGLTTIALAPDPLRVAVLLREGLDSILGAQAGPATLLDLNGNVRARFQTVPQVPGPEQAQVEASGDLLTLARQHVTAASTDQTGWRLQRHSDKRPSVQVVFPAEEQDARFVDKQVATLAQGRLRIRSLVPGDSLVSAPVEVGRGEPNAEFQSCRSATSSYVAVLFPPRDFSTPGEADVYQTTGVWSKVGSVRLPTTGPQSAVPPALACDADRARLSWVAFSAGRGLKVARAWCTKTGCQETAIDVSDVRSSERQSVTAALADFGDRVALLWVAPNRSVQVRLAPLQEIAKSEPKVLVDVAPNWDDPAPQWLDLLVRAEVALVAVSPRNGPVHLLRLQADGIVSSIQVKESP